MNAHQSQHRRQFHPSVEGLEALQLLSGMAHAVAVHPVALIHAEATPAPAAVGVVQLHGTIHSTVKVSSQSLAIAGSGNLGAVGTASINYHIGKNSALPAFTLTTKKGQINLATPSSELLGGGNAVTLTSPTSGKESFSYIVVGGTGAYAHATGSGTLTELIALGKGETIALNLKFS